GHYELKRADGTKRVFDVKAVARPFEITGSWDVSFQPDRGAPPSATFPSLISWHKSDDAGIKYFSGTATYRKTFQVGEAMPAEGRRIFLDLGQVEVMAEVRLNGKNLGTLWKSPYVMEVTDVLQPGDNQLVIKVVN